MSEETAAAVLWAQRREELADMEAIRSRSGLEFMEAIARGELPAPPICRPMNYRLHQVAPGHVVFRGTPEFPHMNPLGTVHGGWYGTLLDSAMACAVMTTVPRGSTYTTLEYKVNVTRPIPPGTEVEALGTVSHAGRSTGVASGEIRRLADGRLYATGSTTCMIMALR